MTGEQTQVLVVRLMKVFPSFGSWVERHSEQLRDVWREVLSYSNFDDASVVVEKLVCGDLEMPPNYEFDRMAILIRKESAKLTSIRNERSTQIEKYFRTGAMELVGKDLTGHISIALGVMVKSHQITPEENKQRMTELLAWDKGGDWLPWMESIVKTKRKKNVLAIE